MSSAPTITAAPGAARLANIQAAIKEQRERLAELDTAVLTNEQALEAAQAREREQHQHDATLRQRISDLERQAATARAELLAAKGTADERAASQTYDRLVRELSEARQTLAAHDKVWGKRTAEHAAEQLRLGEQIAAGHTAFDEAAAVLAALREKERDALADLGEQVYADLAHQINEEQEHCENISAALHEQEAEQAQMIRDAIERLREWPDLAERFTRTYASEAAPADAITRLIDAWLGFRSALEQDGPAAGTDSDAQRLRGLLPLPENLLHLLMSAPDWQGHVGSGLGAQPRSRIFAERRNAIEAARNDHTQRLAATRAARLAGRMLA